MTLRTNQTEKIYQKYLKEKYDGVCIFCAKDLLIKEYKYWILLKNRFPYNKILLDFLVIYYITI